MKTMKNKWLYKGISTLLLICLTLSPLMGCSKSEDMGAEDGENMLGDIIMESTSSAGALADQSQFFENPFMSTAEQPISTFSADVDTASYGLFRKLVNNDYTLTQLQEQGKSFRTEEMVNYFKYDYPLPEEGEVFGQTASMIRSPWNDDTYLMVLGLTTEAIREKGQNNLVFLIDVSGSMASADKLPLLKNAFSCLISSLDERDTVSIVTYSGKEEVILDGVSGNRDEEILSAVNRLQASGATNGQSGLQKAYELAAKHYLAEGNNRIILASDGDLNVGISSPEELKSYISTKRNEGIYLSVMGFGTGNYRDDTMSALAQNGNGVYYYIDCAAEAERVMGTDLLSTLYTVAKDVKLQVTFVPEYVTEYRLIGYENRMLNTEDFDDDAKDGGEVGAGHSLTVCYELKLTQAAATDEGKTAVLATLAMRYQPPAGGDSTLREIPLSGSILTDTPTKDTCFVSAVIRVAMLLHRSEYLQKDVTVQGILAELAELDLTNDSEKQEFVALLRKLG
ncbi:MAG: von Willebrand factor type A domain-containing protein [Clostridia bacterium]|nr:von Willebrand factor type A domain-containing protein [Clostridia bacterium]